MVPGREAIAESYRSEEILSDLGEVYSEVAFGSSGKYNNPYRDNYRIR